MADLTEDEAREIAEDLERRIAEVEERARVAGAQRNEEPQE
jgi:ArsR family metal-binding transcriptional regulator